LATENPKSEYRNPKQMFEPINLKWGKSKTQNLRETRLEVFLSLLI